MNLSFKTFARGWVQFFQEEKQILLTWFLLVTSINLLRRSLGFQNELLALLSIITIRKFLAGGFCCNNKRFDGKYVIITGANTGIGKETALELAARGAKLILACRDVKRAEEVASEIRSRFRSEVRVEKLNLASFESIKSFSLTMIQNYTEIYCLINNAGIMMCPYMETEDGLEMQMGVNHFGHFLLTQNLLPLLKKSQEARIINVSSAAHRWAKIPFDDLKYTKGYNRIEAYGNSKLANILHVRHLAKLLSGTNIQVFALHPGAVQTELGRHLPFGLGFFYSKLVSFIWKTTKEGAQTTLYCATEAVQDPNFYFSDCLADHPSKAARNDEDAEKLWKLSEKMVNKFYVPQTH